MLKYLSVLFLLFISSAAIAQTVAWTTNPANGHSYALVNSTAWADAESQAVALGGHLATINDVAENQWLANWTLGTSAPDRVWIGLYQAAGSPEPAGGWAWVSGQPMDFTNWDNGEPNNALNKEPVGEFYVRTHVSFEHSGSWNDTWAEHPGIPAGIVEKETVVTPEPASLILLLAGILPCGLLHRRRLKA